MKYCFECCDNPSLPNSVLCAVCSQDQEIVDDYLLTEIPARSCTEAQPGSEEKIKVMQERWESGESLFHPEDPIALPANTAIKNLGFYLFAHHTSPGSVVYKLETDVGNNRFCFNYQDSATAKKEISKIAIRREINKTVGFSLFKNHQQFYRDYQEELKRRNRATRKIKKFS